jgi:type IV pilus assembly protein PilV
MVLLGVGLLGLAGLQLRGMQVNQGSNFRSQAAILADDLADRMRVDAATAKANGYNGKWLAAGNLTPAGAAPATVNLVSDWLFRLGNLPSGCANVGTATIPPTTIVTTITISWDDTRAIRAADSGVAAAAVGACPAGAGSGSYVLTTQLQG